MDESEVDRDIVIQRYSADLLADLDESLGPFLRKPNGDLRTRVRERETSRLISQVLEPFQELPQLLDPYLPKYVPLLAEAYLEHVQVRRRRTKSLSLRSQLLVPLSNAICKIIYSFCKIRGEKVIVRFLNVETRYLELLLLAIEESERQSDASGDQDAVGLWTWHERYVVLLWLSQLFFAPFDLSTISSGDTDDAERPIVPGFRWPAQIPGITLRVIPLALKYLASPGKERDGAKALLVRLAMRKDMQEVGILRSLVQWAIFTLSPKKDETAESPYYYIGSLALLAGILRSSANTSIMDPYLRSIFYAVQLISSEDNAVFKVINGSALARKMMIKVTRSVILLVLREPQQSMADTEMVEATIGHLLESLADNDTPVRFAASKALSMITLKLESDMAQQVVEAVLDSLNRNVLWIKAPSPGSPTRTRDLTAVDPLEWHGLMLTLSHLLYRRSPPPESLSDIVNALVMGLSFEKRGTGGASIGTNVRDAACFGIWALARRYSTEELLQVPTQSIRRVAQEDPSMSILQVVAVELVVAASLDPAGNIRRGSSAALQELIGRHPDTVTEGIAVVQTVDYHAVALRSRAIHDVALQATRLSPQYGLGLLEAQLGWRGVGDMDAAARRVAAASFGTLTAEISQRMSNKPEHFLQSVDLLLARIDSLQVRQVEERHGLVLSLAAVFDYLPALVKGDMSGDLTDKLPIRKLIDAITTILKNSITTTYRKPELIAEAVSQLVISAYPLFLMVLVPEKREAANTHAVLLQGKEITCERHSSSFLTAIASGDVAGIDHRSILRDLTDVLLDAINIWLNRNEEEVIAPVSQVSVVLLFLTEPQNRRQVIHKWISTITESRGSRNKHGSAYFVALAQTYHVAASLSDGPPVVNDVIQAFKVRWESDKDTETRVAIIESLVGRDILRRQVLAFRSIISEGLDDYTTNARGDVGSHVRLAAIKATHTLWETSLSQDLSTEQFSTDVLIFFPKVLRLAAEKLDRVRIGAQAALGVLVASSYADTLRSVSFSSQQYFAQLFGMCTAASLSSQVMSAWSLTEGECTSSLLAGLATSADTGNEDLVIASRAALAHICRSSTNDLSKICIALIHNLKLHQGQDRIVVPTLELIAYLFHVGIFQQSKDINLRQLCLLTQKAGYKTGNVRKLEACIKVYGGIATTPGSEGGAPVVTSELELKRQEGITEAKRRLGALLNHPWPKIRNLAVDELWGSLSGESDHVSRLLSTDWGKAEKPAIKTLVEQLGLN
ncbi:hypothetical protein JX266_008172 [Neoarthrinium moseri]|nr:hypothetical protein JX266_008172 [Neoarthrinium moseri]